MNWRRGLFRLWLAASFLWLVGVGALLQEETRRDVSILWAFRDVTEEILEAATSPEKDLLAESPPPPIDLAERSLNPPPPIDWVEELRKLEEPDISPCEELNIRRLIARYTPHKAAKNGLVVAAFVLLLPPILAFALGWAGLWILRGFRS